MKDYLLMFDINGYIAQYVIRAACFEDAQRLAESLADGFNEPTDYNVEEWVE